MLIAIVDDENQWSNRIEKVLKPYMNRSSVPYEIRKFSSGRDFLLAAKERVFDILFLDVKMDEMDGFETADAFREENPNALLIFVSSVMQYARVGYRFDAMRYLLKDNIEVDFEECMETLFRAKRLQEKTIELKGNGKEKLALFDIVYVESQQRKVEIHLASTPEIKESSEKLDDFEERLESKDFLRVHQSFLVDMRYITKFKDEIELRNGQRVPVSRAYLKEARRLYNLWRG